MRFLSIALLIFVFLFCISNVSCAAEMSSTNYKITSSVISGGGNVMSSTNYHLISTSGQSSPLGSTSSGGYIINSGFWYTMLLGTIGDVNGDGDVNLEDVIAALQIVTGQFPATIIKEADANGDGKIGLSEALYILRKLGE